MAELAIVARAAGLLAVLVVAGVATGRAGRRRVDAFAAVWFGAALLSLIGTTLARMSAFSLVNLGAATLGVSAIAVVCESLFFRPHVVAAPLAETRRLRVIAALMGLAAVAWTWPPYETYFAAADSTMYVNAGAHLARTGSYDVTGTIAPTLPPALAKSLFASVGFFDRGPYVRLPGGLLMTSRSDALATPAFFPLVSTWTGMLAAVGGPELATLVAPLGLGLAVWALTLFAGETAGVAAAVVTGVVFLANFAVWWFGRFTMSEPLTIAFVWGAFVFLRRREPLAAGMMLALAGVARSEMVVFALVALALWAAWARVSRRDVIRVGAGLVVGGVVAALGVAHAPNHHIAYLTNDVLALWARWSFRMMPALFDGRLPTVMALAPMVPILIVIMVMAMGGDVGRNLARVLLTAAVVLAAGLYAWFGGGLDMIRHCRWLAISMSPLGLACGVVGIVELWRRGGPAGRLAVILMLVIAAVFLPSPRVAPYQPWAMRRYLPVVLPALALGAGMLIQRMIESRRMVTRAFAAVVTIAIVAWQVPPTLVARRADYFSGTLVGASRLAAKLPDDALVVVDGSFADAQIQVPLWLVFGRESVMATGGGPAWRDLLATLVTTDRPIYWIQNAYTPPPVAAGLAFNHVDPNVELTVVLPDSPTDTPPAIVMRKVLPLAVYGVAAVAGLGEGMSMPMRLAHSAVSATPSPSRMEE